MGNFSWKYADTNNKVAMLDDVYKDSYLLVPAEFKDKYGEYILEECYDGYGHFGKYDIYELIAEWNRDCIPNVIRLIKKGIWTASANEREMTLLEEYYKGGAFDNQQDNRIVGITMACYDTDNRRLDYPIKITARPMTYESCWNISEADENQGWGSESEDDEDDN